MLMNLLELLEFARHPYLMIMGRYDQPHISKNPSLAQAVKTTHAHTS